MDYCATVAAESARFAEVLAGADPRTPVPSCPGWDAAELVWHLTEVQAFWSVQVEQATTDPVDADIERPNDYPALLDLFLRQSHRLSAALETADPQQPAWTWSGDHTVGFVRRRQAHEALIHRVDGELTAGAAPAHVDSAVAADGVAEVVELFLTGLPEWGVFEADDRVLEIDLRDHPAAWRLAVGRFSGTSPLSGNRYEGLPAAVLSDGDPTGTVSGDSVDVDLWLWGRGPADRLEGDDEAKAALRLLAADSTQ